MVPRSGTGGPTKKCERLDKMKVGTLLNFSIQFDFSKVREHTLFMSTKEGRGGKKVDNGKGRSPKVDIYI